MVFLTDSFAVEMTMSKDLTARLPEGMGYAFWEKEMLYDRELHVSINHPDASDDNDGSLEHPFKTIQAAADKARPGTRVWIHGGVYRECVRPVCSGEGPDRLICYEAFDKDQVIIKASEEIRGFQVSEGWQIYPFGKTPGPEEIRIWEIKLKPDMFQGYNPFGMVNILHDRLYIEYDKTDMTTYMNRRGMVFCDGRPLQQVSLYEQMSEIPGSFWVEANGQKVHFRLENDENPREHTIEITCREQCFAPEIPFLSYIKLKGLTCAHAATGAPVPQRGAISCGRGHHWIIEDCTIDWSNGVGIDIGNECWHHTRIRDQVLGYTIIRRCHIYDVGVCGIAGMFTRDLLIEDNYIKGTGWQRMELSWEAAGIKVHGCRNSLIRRNVFSKTFRADHLWMDVGNENNRITQNLFLDGIEQREAVFIECSRDGVNLIDNNIFWNIEGRFDRSLVKEKPGSSGWYNMEEDSVITGWAIYGEGTDHLHIVNNLIGRCRSAGYFAKPVPFRISGRGGTSRDAQIYNNIFYECGEAAIKFPTQYNKAEGNFYVRMPGGFLRILYPAPAVCLDLKAWQEFYGLDVQGQEGWLDICVDTERLTLTVDHAGDRPLMLPGREPGPDFVTDTAILKAVPSDAMTPTDFYGMLANISGRIPGPFSELTMGMVYSIDPRKPNGTGDQWPS